MSYFEQSLSLTYNHSTGGLVRYFEGLLEGRALATRCNTCGRVWFAPRLHCCGAEPAMTWLELPGTGVIAAATTGGIELPFSGAPARDALALVRMDGAHNQVLGWIDGHGHQSGLPAPGTRVQLVRATDILHGDTTKAVAAGHPSQSALFVAL